MATRTRRRQLAKRRRALALKRWQTRGGLSYCALLNVWVRCGGVSLKDYLGGSHAR